MNKKYKPRSPFAGDSSGLFLPWMVMVMVFLASLMISLNAALHRGLHDWYKGVSSEITLQVMPSENKDSQTQTVLALLEKSEEYEKVHLVSEEEMKSMLSPYLGDMKALEPSMVPDMITLVPKEGVLKLRSLEQIKENFKDVKVGTSQEWLMHMRNFIKSIENIIRLILGLVFFSMIFIVVYAVKTSLRVHAKAIGLLHLIGARDRYIARKFSGRNFSLALLGSMVGALMTIPFIHIMKVIIDQLGEGLLKNIKFSYQDDIALMVLPVVTSVFVYVMTYMTVKQDLLRRA